MRRWMLVISLLLAHLVLIIGSQVVAIFPSKAPYTSGHFVGFALVVCQADIAAICAVLGSWSARRRALLAAALCVGVWATFTSCLAIGLTEGRERFPVAATGVAAVVLASFCAGALLLRLLQMAAAWRIVSTPTPVDAASDAVDARHVRQFRIVELWTATVVAALLVWCAVAAAARTSDELNLAYVGSFGLVIVWQTLQMPLIIWTALAPVSFRQAARRLGIYLLFTLLATPILGEVGGLISDLPVNGYADATITYAVVLLLTLYVLRWAGFRLVGLPHRFPMSIYWNGPPHEGDQFQN